MIIKPLTAIIVMSVFVKAAYYFGLNFLNRYNVAYAYQINTFAVIIFASFIYFITLLLLKEIKYNDLAVLPVFGKKLADFLKKVALID